VTPLLDVNLLVALTDPYHAHAALAHEWLAQRRETIWATCAVVLNGAVRVLGHPRFGGDLGTIASAVERLGKTLRQSRPVVWSGDLTMLDEGVFRPEKIPGPKLVTDVYLLGLAVRNDGCLATFDRNIPLAAVVGAEPRHLEVVG